MLIISMRDWWICACFNIFTVHDKGEARILMSLK